MLFFIVLYIAFAIIIIKIIFASTKRKKIRYSAIVIAIIFPFWDTILNNPIYKILSDNIPEIERYQPYEKIKGFYVDFVPQGNIAYSMFSHNTFENNYSIYYHKLENRNKEKIAYKKFYYKATWLNNSSSPTCFPPQPSSVEDDYINLIKNNWCISVKEIEESEMTKYWKVDNKIVFHIPLLNMNIYIVDFFVSDRHTGKNFFRLRDVFVDQSWLSSLNIVSGTKYIRSGTKYTHARYTHYKEGKYFEFPDHNIIKILDSKELPDIRSNEEVEKSKF